MKKLFIFAISILMLTGCKKNDISTVIKKFSDDVTSSNSYLINGSMVIITDEEEFNYTFSAKYLANDYYKVILNNENNNHEQIILKNNDGVYVITPAINKSFKFQSSWPDNSSQSYLLRSLLKDINNDNNAKLEKSKDGYVITTIVNYPNNSELSHQKLYFDKSINLKKVIVYGKDNNEKIITKFSKIDLKASSDKDEFKIDEYIKNSDDVENRNCEKENCDKEASSILDDIIYPLYLPSNTYLTSSEKISSGSNRVILTFSGDKQFTIIEEALSIPNEFEINPVYGDPVFLNDAIGVMSDGSIKWNRGNISYYIAGNNLSNEEIVTIATSMNHAMSVLGSK